MIALPAQGEETNITHCLCCGSAQTQERDVLWPELINEWRIASHEVSYINRQQGFHCAECGANLRSMALAQAIMACYGYTNRFADFVGSATARPLRVLEINEAGALTQVPEDAAELHVRAVPRR